VIVVSLWLVLMPLGLIAARTLLPSDGLPVMDAGTAFTEDGLRVSPPHPVHQILDGDHVISVGGRSIDDLLANPVARDVATGDQLELVVERGSERFTTTIDIGDRRQFGALLDLSWPALAVAAVLLGLTIWLVVRQPDEPAAHALMLFSAAVASVVLGEMAFLEPLDLWARPWVTAWSLIGLACFMELAVALVMFALAFPGGTGGSRASWSATVARWLMLVPIVVTSGAAALYLMGWYSLSRNHAINDIAGVWWMIGMLAALGILAVRGWKLRRDAVARRQSQIVLLGLASTLVPWFAINLVPGDASLGWFALILLPFPAAVAIAVAHDNLFDLDVILSRGLVAAFTGAVLLAAYFAVVGFTIAVAGASGPLAEVPAAGVVAVLFAPVRQRSQRWVDRRFYGLAAEPGVVFGRLGERLSNAGEPDALLAAVVETVMESLRLPFVALELRLAGVSRTVEQRGQPTEVVESVELCAEGEVLGRLLVSPRRGETALNARDAALLADLGRHAAVAAKVSLLTNTLREEQHQTVVLREAERERTQRDLHDRIGPVFVGLALQLSALADETDPTTAKALLRRLQEQASNALEDVRRLARDLRPAELEEIGLFAALQAAANRLSTANDFEFDVQVPLALPRLSRHREDATYLVCLEAMANAVRHGGGDHARVRLALGADDSLQGVIEDDGTGFPDAAREGTGLTSIRHRIGACGGHVEIGRSPLGGAMISFELPPEGPR
jgi:signal transduction histidine kinase